MGWGTWLSGDALFTGCVNSTVNDLYKPVNGIFGQFALSFENMALNHNTHTTAAAADTLSETLDMQDDRWRQTHLGRLLGHAMRRFDERVLHLMAGNEGVPLALANLASRDQISAAHVHITRHLALGGSRLTDLARAAGMSKQAMGDLVDQCTAWGLVQREPDPLDARARRVVFTPVGLAWLQAFKDAVAQAETEFREAVGKDVATVVALGLEAYAH
jgi:DNA-binding MarR family transcriptional regulator